MGILHPGKINVGIFTETEFARSSVTRRGSQGSEGQNKDMIRISMNISDRDVKSLNKNKQNRIAMKTVSIKYNCDKYIYNEKKKQINITF